MKKKIRKTQNRAEVLLEDLRSDFKAFGETLLAVKKKGDATFEEVERIKEELTSMSDRLDSVSDRQRQLEKRVEKIENKVGKIDQDMQFVKDELRLIRNELKQKISLEEFNILEKRVTRLEKIVSALS